MKTYIDWAVTQGFSVIDVNLPKHHTADESDSQGHERDNSIENRTAEATQLLTYLWENYIELNEATHVFLLGTNTGHGAIINFIKANEDRAQEKLTRAISFVQDVPLQSCKSATNDALAGWYYQSSLVFVAVGHNFWYSDYARKIKKRFGHVFKSPEESISEMLTAHKETVTEMLLEETEHWRANRAASDDEDMADTSAANAAQSRNHMPPVGNFALSSPARAVNLNKTASPSVQQNSNFISPSGRRVGSPTKAPPIANFALSPRNGAPRSPAR